MRTLILGLGNDLLGDDGIGLVAAEKLEGLIGHRADVVTSSLHGLALLDLFIGYDKAVIIDAVQKGGPPGGIYELRPDDLRSTPGPSPHFTGLPEMILIAGELQLPFPDEIKILAIEVAETFIVSEKLTPAVAAAVDRVGEYICGYLDDWESCSVVG